MPPRPPVAFPFAEFLISPRTTWTRFFNPQFFITYNDGDAEIENYVLSRAGSYGKQLGTVLDALDVVVRRVPADTLTAAERRVFDELAGLRERVDRAKDDFRGDRDAADRSADAVDRVLAQLADLERTDPAAHAALVERLRAGLPDDAGG